MIDDIDIKKRYEHNPFVGKKVITSQKKRITIGSSSDVILSHDGEIKGTTVGTYREVDDAMFVKLFTQNIGLTFNLSANGVKALTVLIWAVQQGIGRDVYTLDKYTHADFLAENGDLKMAYVTFAKGLNELTKAQIIAKAQRMGDYYINPHFVFNGDRIVFVNEIRRKSANKLAKLEEQGQKRLLE